MRRLTGSVFLILLLPLLASAQDAGNSWDNLNQLRAGQKIEVVDMKMKSVVGKFVSSSDDAITIQKDGDTVSLPRPDVYRVSSREDSKRGRNMLTGLAVGAGAGLAIGAALDARVNYESDECCMGMAIVTPIGAGVGFGLGAASHGYRTIYRAEARRSAPSQ
jgi:hypothetical protein